MTVAATRLLLVVVLAGCGGTSNSPTTPLPPAAPAPPAGRVKTIPPGPYGAGVSYFGRANYIEYIPGTLPVVITAPHGGTLTPAEIPDRTTGVLVTDSNTDELALAVATAFSTLTGQRPHVIITRLSRKKIDTNRDSAEATAGNANAVTAWFEFHDFIDVARQAIGASPPGGFYLDLHGHGHAIPRLELGYLLTNGDLGQTDATLDTMLGYERQSSVRSVSEQTTAVSFSALLRGSTSLGALFVAEGYPSVPSPDMPAPGAADYFDGGYNTARYGCAVAGPTCGVQIEANYVGVRDNAANRAKFATAIAKVIEQYLRLHTAIRLVP